MKTRIELSDSLAPAKIILRDASLGGCPRSLLTLGRSEHFDAVQGLLEGVDQILGILEADR
jgi:hypothetical protein